MQTGGRIWASMKARTCKHSPIIPGGLLHTNTQWPSAERERVRLCQCVCVYCAVRGHLSPSIMVTPWFAVPGSSQACLGTGEHRCTHTKIPLFQEKATPCFASSSHHNNAHVSVPDLHTLHASLWPVDTLPPYEHLCRYPHIPTTLHTISSHPSLLVTLLLPWRYQALHLEKCTSKESRRDRQ